MLNSHHTGQGEALQKMPVEDSSAMFAQQHNSQNMAPQLWDQPEKEKKKKDEWLTYCKTDIEFSATKATKRQV